MNKPILKGVAPASEVRRPQVDRKDRKESEAPPKMTWQTAEAGAVEVALEDGRLTLTEGLRDEKGKLDEIATEERLLDMVKEGISFSALNETDQAMAKRLLEAMKEDFSGDEGMTQQLGFVESGLKQLNEIATKKQAVEAGEKAEIEEMKKRIVEMGGREMPEEASTEEGFDEKTEGWFDQGNEMTAEVHAEEAGPDAILRDRNAFEFAISHAEELGFAELKNLTFAEVQADLAEKKKIQNELSSAGFFKKIFGLGSSKKNLARINARLAAVERLSAQMDAYVAMEDNAHEETSGEKARERMASRRQETNERMRKTGRGGMM